MTFLNPWAIYVGLGAAALPVVVHWLTRPRPRRMPLSTLRFVHEAIRDRRARHRLRDFIILALRTLAIVAVALAIARPRFGDRSSTFEGASGDAVAVVLLDQSASMNAVNGGVAAIERARTVAAGCLRYRPGLRADLVLANSTARAVFDRPSSNFEALRDELGRCRALPVALDAGLALEKAAEILAPESESDRRDRELIIVSDFQRSSWSAADFSVLPANTRIRFEAVSPPQRLSNVAIVRAEGRAMAAGGRGVQLEVDVLNSAPAPRQVAVEFSLGESAWRLSGVCPADGKTTLSLPVDLRQSGWQHGQARLLEIDDALALDNVRPVAFHLRPEVVVALVTRQTERQRPSSSHYIQCALAPGPQDSQGGVRIDRIDPLTLEAASLAGSDLIVLAHPGRLAPEGLQLIAGVLRRGRPLLYVAAEPADAVNLRQLADAVGGGWRLPVEFSPRPAGQARREVSLAAVRGEEPPLRAFGDALPALVRQLRFTPGLGSRPLPGGLAGDLRAAYSDGSACLVVAAADAGAVAVLNVDLLRSNLPRSGAFVPIVSELVDHLLEHHRRGQSASCGEPLIRQLPSDAAPCAGLTIVPPVEGDGEADYGELVDEAAGPLWRWLSPTETGVYRVCRGTDVVYAAAIQTPADESDLSVLPADVLTDRLAGGRQSVYRGMQDDDRGNDDVWKWCAVGCVLAMLGEIGALLAFRT
jgi:hypothetical protein